MKHVVLAAALVLIAALVAVGPAGCEPSSTLTVVVEEGANALRVNLPAVPTLPPPPQPVTHPDGAHTIWGIRHVAARNWNKSVRVRGYITRAYVPMIRDARTHQMRPCRELDRCLEDKPHIFIADTANEQDPERLMMVTGYAQFQADIDTARLAARRPGAAPAVPAAPPGGPLPPPMPIDFYDGARVVVTGTLVRHAPNGMGDSNGLLNYISHVTETPSPLDPVAIAAAAHPPH